MHDDSELNPGLQYRPADKLIRMTLKSTTTFFLALVAIPTMQISIVHCLADKYTGLPESRALFESFEHLVIRQTSPGVPSQCDTICDPVNRVLGAGVRPAHHKSAYIPVHILLM